jgi:hypothetical protein
LEQVFGADNVDYMAGIDAEPDGSSANGYDVVYISSTMASSNTREKYEDSTVGIVFGENALISDDSIGNFMMSDSGGNQDMVTNLEKTKINIVDPSHPLAAGLSGEVTVFDSEPTLVSGGYWWQFGRGNLAPGVVRVAESLLDFTPPEPQQHAILAAEVGAQLLGDGTAGRPSTAAGRRVFFFLSDFGAADLTTEGFALLNAAINWAGADPPMSVPGDHNADGKVDAADYVTWRKDPAAHGGDPDGYNIWKTNFGRTSAGSALGGGAAVPEPTSWLPAAFVVAGITALKRDRKMVIRRDRE